MSINFFIRISLTHDLFFISNKHPFFSMCRHLETDDSKLSVHILLNFTDHLRKERVVVFSGFLFMMYINMINTIVIKIIAN